MASRKQVRLAEIRRYIDERGIGTVREIDFDELRSRLAPIGDSQLRTLLRDVDLPLDTFVEGVRQQNFDELERTLVLLAHEYTKCTDRVSAIKLRRVVITAKDHARFAARSAKDPERRAEKEEMAEWILVWLENPAIFPQWVALRRRAIIAGRSIPP
jgi:hypothetical protein